MSPGSEQSGEGFACREREPASDIVAIVAVALLVACMAGALAAPIAAAVVWAWERLA